MFIPYLIHKNKENYRFFTHALIHADFTHLLFNMLTLYFFGPMVEAYFSIYFQGKAELFYILLYVGGVVLSSFWSYEKYKNNSLYSALGASGAVSAVLFSGILLAPLNPIYIMFIPFPIPAFVFGALYLIYSWYMAKRGKDNIGHDAHFWGAVFGIVFPIVIKPELALLFIKRLSGEF